MLEKVPPDLSRFLICPMPGMLMKLHVAEGETVQPGQPLATVEAMKMENILRAEKGRDREDQRGGGRKLGGGRCDPRTGAMSRNHSHEIPVPVKRVIDYNLKPRVKPDLIGRGPRQCQDEHEPVRRDRGGRGDPAEGTGAAEEIVAVSIGPAKAQETLRTALAMGADRAILIRDRRAGRAARGGQAPQAIAVQEQPGS